MLGRAPLAGGDAAVFSEAGDWSILEKGFSKRLLVLSLAGESQPGMKRGKDANRVGGNGQPRKWPPIPTANDQASQGSQFPPRTNGLQCQCLAGDFSLLDMC